jgi:hypothetical protein
LRDALRQTHLGELPVSSEARWRKFRKLEDVTSIFVRRPAEFLVVIHDPIATMLLVNCHSWTRGAASRFRGHDLSQSQRTLPRPKGDVCSFDHSNSKSDDCGFSIIQIKMKSVKVNTRWGATTNSSPRCNNGEPNV